MAENGDDEGYSLLKGFRFILMSRMATLEGKDRENHLNNIRLALSSGIRELECFVSTVRSHISGILSHVRYQVSSGRIEGFNSRIKSVKRIGYGYRDEGYFFSLIRYISIPTSKPESHMKT